MTHNTIVQGAYLRDIYRSLKSQVSVAKEPHKRDDILQKRPVIIRSLLIEATPYRVPICVIWGGYD